MLSPGCVVHGEVRRSVLAPGVVVERGATVRDSVLLEDVFVSTGARVQKAVLDKGVKVGTNARVGGGKELTLIGMEVGIEAGERVEAGKRLEPQVEDSQ